MTQVLIAAAILGAIGLLGGALLAVVSTLCDKGDNNEKAALVREALPGANCGACGFAGCDAYAEAIANGTAEANLCAPGGKETAEKLSKILGIEVVSEEKVAMVSCNGCSSNVDTRFNYVGIKSCVAAASVLGGPSACEYGCIGFGDCVSACSFNAISVTDGLAKVDGNLCGGCGSCATVCPKEVIKIVPKLKSAKLLCNNHQKGATAKKVCKTACIGCGLCAKKCENGAITVENFLAQIDPTKCNACGKCVDACPQKIISIF